MHWPSAPRVVPLTLITKVPAGQHSVPLHEGAAVARLGANVRTAGRSASFDRCFPTETMRTSNLRRKSSRGAVERLQTAAAAFGEVAFHAGRLLYVTAATTRPDGESFYERGRGTVTGGRS